MRGEKRIMRIEVEPETNRVVGKRQEGETVVNCRKAKARVSAVLFFAVCFCHVCEGGYENGMGRENEMPTVLGRLVGQQRRGR